LNLPYLLIHIFVLLTYAAGEFSILSGWEFVQNASENEIRLTPKVLMAAFFAVVVPVALFFMSIIFGYTSYARILHPVEVLYDEEYGLKKFYDKKAETVSTEKFKK
jgi:thiamine transporter ThiT